MSCNFKVEEDADAEMGAGPLLCVGNAWISQLSLGESNMAAKIPS